VLKKNLFSVVVIFIVIFIIITFNGNTVKFKTGQSVDSITLLKFKDFQHFGNEIIRTYSKKEDVATIIKVINNSKQIDLNTANIAKADYCINITFKDRSNQGYYILIDKQEKWVFLMDAKNTNIGYELYGDMSNLSKIIK